jgi:hypothetical protein
MTRRGRLSFRRVGLARVQPRTNPCRDTQDRRQSSGTEGALEPLVTLVTTGTLTPPTAAVA